MNFNLLVLDETDRMLDMGFDIQLQEIIEVLPKKRQTMMFTATIGDTERMAKKYLTDPVRVSIQQDLTPSANIKQEVINCGEKDKYKNLLSEVKTREGSIIVFVKTKASAERLAEKLEDEDHSVGAIHGDLRQRERERVLSVFRQGRTRIMVATDVAARGLDVPHIQHVINYDLPMVAEDFIHRIGRTARAGATGNALSFVAPGDGRRWNAIQRLINPNFKADPSKREPREESSRGGYKGKSSPFKGGFKGGPKKAFGAPREGGARDESRGEGFRPKKTFEKKSSDEGFKPRSEGFKGKTEGFKGKSEGFKPRSEGFKGKSEGFKGEGFKKRSEGFKGKSEGSKAEGFKPRSEGFKGKSEGFKGESFKPKSEGFKGKKPFQKSDGNVKPKRPFNKAA
jgi:superfamily II DNA/RNA helicase